MTYNLQLMNPKEDLQIYNFFTSKVVDSATQISPNLQPTEYVTPLLKLVIGDGFMGYQAYSFISNIRPLYLCSMF